MGQVRARNLAYDTLPVLIHGNGPTKVGRGPSPRGESWGERSRIRGCALTVTPSFPLGLGPPTWDTLTASVLTSEFRMVLPLCTGMVSDALSVLDHRRGTVSIQAQAGLP